MNEVAKDSAGFPIGTRWVRVDAFDKTGKKLGHVVCDVLNYGTPAHANSAAMGALVRTFGEDIDPSRLKVTWGN